MKDCLGYENDRSSSQAQIQQTDSESTKYENNQDEELGATQEFDDHNEENIDVAIMGRKRKFADKVNISIFVVLTILPDFAGAYHDQYGFY